MKIFTVIKADVHYIPVSYATNLQVVINEDEIYEDHVDELTTYEIVFIGSLEQCEDFMKKNRYSGDIMKIVEQELGQKVKVFYSL